MKRVRKKWQDLKSKAVTKKTKNDNQTGNRPCIEYSKWEEKVLDFLAKQKSNIISGIASGLESTTAEVNACKYL